VAEWLVDAAEAVINKIKISLVASEVMGPMEAELVGLLPEAVLVLELV